MGGALAGVKDCPWDSSLSSGAEQNLIYFRSDEAVDYFDFFSLIHVHMYACT